MDLTAALLCLLLAPAAEPFEPAPQPPAYEERGFLTNHFPLVLDSPLHPSVEDKVFVVFALIWLFPELGAGVWAPMLADEEDTPEGYLSEALWGCGIHAASTLLCPPCLIPMNTCWFQPVFALNTYSRYRWLADAAKREAAPPPPKDPKPKTPGRREIEPATFAF